MKYQSEHKLENVEILTDMGYKPILRILETKPMPMWSVDTLTHHLEAADKHIVMTDNGDAFMDELQPGMRLLTDRGPEPVLSIDNLKREESCVDFILGDDSHVYYADGVLSHNTTTSMAFLLHQAITRGHIRIAILANKLSTATEILDRLKFAYENLPWFLQVGIETWNKQTVKLGNGTEIIAAATSSSSIRGKSINCLAGDTRITIQHDDNTVESIALQDLYHDAKQYGIARYQIINNYGIELCHKTMRLRILSEDGVFRDFDGISMGTSDSFLRILFDDGRVLRTTDNHKVMTAEGTKPAGSLCTGDQCYRADGHMISIKNIEREQGGDCFDIIHVDETHSYFADDILVGNCLMIDEMAHIDNDVEWMASTYPVISSFKNSRVIITSTPKGLNLFHQLFKGAKEGHNAFKPSEYDWRVVPGRDEAWKEETIANTSPMQFAQEYECVGGNTEIEVMLDGEPKTISVEALYYSPDATSHLVKTPFGYREFAGIQKQTKPCIKICFDDGRDIVCTHNHHFVDGEINTIASSLRAGDVLQGRKIISIEEQGEQPVYDLLDVDGHLYYTNGLVSHNCAFFGSSDTLLSGDCLQSLSYINPIHESEHMRVYAMPEPSKTYCIAVDTALGTGGDYSVAVVFDVSAMPYKLVAVFRHNLMQPIEFAAQCFELHKQYNDAFMIVENNSYGKIVADSLWYDYDCDNMFCGKEGWEAGAIGMTTTKRTKAIGCSHLKALIESKQLEIRDAIAILELSTFSKTRSGSYAAENGKHDDICMALVMFAYVASLDYFANINDINFRHDLREAMESTTSFMFIDDGTEEIE